MSMVFWLTARQAAKAVLRYTYPALPHNRYLCMAFWVTEMFNDELICNFAPGIKDNFFPTGCSI